jgi:hypothetical protein
MFEGFMELILKVTAIATGVAILIVQTVFGAFFQMYKKSKHFRRFINAVMVIGIIIWFFTWIASQIR